MCQDPSHRFFSDPDQNKEDTSFISVVAYGAYIPLSHLIQLCLLTNQNFEKNAYDPADPWIQDPSRVLPFSWGSSHLIKYIPCDITYYSMDN